MKTNRFTLIFVSFVLLVMLGGCGTLQVAPIPTNTPAPTMTPEPALKCDISNDSANGNLNVGFDIVTESVSEASPLVTTYNNEEQDFTYDSTGQVSLFTVHINRDLLYKSSGHTYHIEGVITIAPATQVLNYNITATGATLSSPQKCTK